MTLDGYLAGFSLEKKVEIRAVLASNPPSGRCVSSTRTPKERALRALRAKNPSVALASLDEDAHALLWEAFR